MTDSPSVTIEDLLRRMRQDALFQRAIDPTLPDPEPRLARLEDLARRYPPIPKGDGYDFMPLVKGAALESGLDESRLAEVFQSAAAAVATDRASAVEAAEELLRNP